MENNITALAENPDTWYSLKLGESVKTGLPHATITRVPGGWVWNDDFEEEMNTVFIPFNNEFQPNPHP
jgi:hypothetical protein